MSMHDRYSYVDRDGSELDPAQHKFVDEHDLLTGNHTVRVENTKTGCCMWPVYALDYRTCDGCNREFLVNVHPAHRGWIGNDEEARLVPKLKCYPPLCYVSVDNQAQRIQLCVDCVSKIPGVSALHAV